MTRGIQGIEYGPYFKERKLKKPTNEEVPGNAVGQGGVNMAPNMGPRIKAMNVTDRRRRKDKQPVMLKRFRTFVDEK